MLLDFNAKKNSKFKFSLGSGQRCVLRDLKLDPEFLAKLLPGIPFEVESGVIDQITVHAKLHSIKTEPTLVDIGTVEIIIRESGRGAADAAGAAADDSARGARAPLRESSSGEGLDRLAASGASSSTPGKSAGPSSGSSNASKLAGASKDLTNQTMETPAGTLRKRVKKHSNLAQKIGDGIHWKVREIRITLLTAGEMKRDKLSADKNTTPHNTAHSTAHTTANNAPNKEPGTSKNLTDPPALTLVIRDLDLFATDEHGNK